jgi:GTPase SAR1 family protein
MSTDKEIPVVKLMMIEDSGVGKSCLTLRFSDGVFKPTFLTTSPAGYIPLKNIDLDGRRIMLQSWEERFKTITTQYYGGSQGLLVSYDTTDLETFENVRKWMESIDQHAKDDTKRILIVQSLTWSRNVW